MKSHTDNQRIIETCQLPCQLIFSTSELRFWWRQPSTEGTAFPSDLDLGLCTTRTEVRSKAHQMFQHLATSSLLGAELNPDENYNFNTEIITQS